jgi:hypothetical protein
MVAAAVGEVVCGGLFASGPGLSENERLLGMGFDSNVMRWEQLCPVYGQSGDVAEKILLWPENLPQRLIEKAHTNVKGL